MTPLEIETAYRHGLEDGKDQERRRVIGFLLAAYGLAKVLGKHDEAATIDQLAIDIESGYHLLRPRVEYRPLPWNDQEAEIRDAIPARPRSTFDDQDEE